MIYKSHSDTYEELLRRADIPSLLYTYRDLRAKKHRDKNSLFALERPADWPYNFFTSEKRRIDARIGYIIILTSEQNRVARSSLLLTDK